MPTHSVLHNVAGILLAVDFAIFAGAITFRLTNQQWAMTLTRALFQFGLFLALAVVVLCVLRDHVGQRAMNGFVLFVIGWTLTWRMSRLTPPNRLSEPR